MVKEHLNACADCNAIYQKLLSHTNEDVLHEESESVIMRHEVKEKQRGRKKITIAVLVSIALCILSLIHIFHLSVTQTKRSAGQSAIASAAYRAGERLYSEYYGEYSDYTRKGGVICSDILLPSHAPKEYADRQTLWNAVEKAERGKNAQLAYSFDIALQNEFRCV